MGPILASIFGGSIGKTIETVIDRVVVDKNIGERAKAELQKELANAAVQGDLAQIELNKIEAANPSILVSGWRPGVGWVCVIGLLLQFIFFPLLYWALQIGDYLAGNLTTLPPPPMFDDMLWQLVLAMLGMGTLRTFEKFTKVSSK